MHSLTVTSVYQITMVPPAQCSVSLNQTSTSAPPVLPTECALVTLLALTVSSVRLTTTGHQQNARHSVNQLQLPDVTHLDSQFLEVFLTTVQAHAQACTHPCMHAHAHAYAYTHTHNHPLPHTHTHTNTDNGETDSNTGRDIGIGVGVTVGVIILIVMCIGCCCTIGAGCNKVNCKCDCGDCANDCGEGLGECLVCLFCTPCICVLSILTCGLIGSK